ncbi:hypothetical protein ACC764_27600 [Rhizobium ruizarguesonis]|jgi:hypothetical protein|uniref:hypothetical protein n=1 Tax=Rhizobium leguminosarum TaxID=384 RepID=UPI0004B138CD|nr:hypothetical protein [Rhizobium leguminosarum]WFT88389.1 hypothetical protein QA638_12635 [Rhizobium leguminosarum]
MLYDPPITITAEIAERLVSLEGKRLPVPVAPRPEEGLADLIYRAACVNGFTRTSQMFLAKSSYSHAAFALEKVDNPAICELLGTPNGEDDLTGLRYTRWPGPGNWIDFFGAALPKGQFTGWRRVSPTALRHSLHSKAIWHINALTFDPQNYETLLEECPVCRTRLDFRHTAGISRCHVCGPSVDFRDFPQSIIDSDDMAALDFGTGLINPGSPDGKARVSALHPEIRDENPGHLFILCVLIASIFEDSRRVSGRRVISQATVSPQNLARAARAVLSWPEGLMDILSSSGTFSSSGEKSQAHSFSALCRGTHVLNSSLYDLVNQLSLRTKMRETKAGPLRRLQLSADSFSADEASAITKFGALQHSGVFAAARMRTKLPPVVLFNCYLSGVCGPLSSRSNEVKAHILGWASALRFYIARPAADILRDVRVRSFVASFGLNSGDVWPAVLAAIQDGTLPVKRAPGIDDPQIDDLYVDDIAAWHRFLLTAKGVIASAKFPLSIRDIAFYLDVSLSTVVRYRVFDLTQSVTYDDVQHFRRENILLTQLICVAATHGRQMSRSKVHKELDAAGIRSPGDNLASRCRDRSMARARPNQLRRFTVPRVEALRYYGLL